MKAETSGTEAAEDSAAPTAVGTPDNASQADIEAPGSGSGSDDGATDNGTTSHSADSSTATAVGTIKGKDKGKGKDSDSTSTASAKKPEAPKPEAKKEQRAGKNLVGRINNLVSSDLNSLDFASMHIVFASAFLSLVVVSVVPGADA